MNEQQNIGEHDPQIKAGHESMFNYTEDAIAWFDHQGIIFNHNPRFAQIIQSPSNLQGENIFNLLDPRKNRQQAFCRALQGDTVAEEIELVVNQASLHLAVRLGPIRMGQEIIGAYVILIDLTENKHVEATLREREYRLRTLVSKASLGIAIHDQEYRIIEANERFTEMLGYSLEELKQLHIWDWDANMSKEDILRDFGDLSQVDAVFETRHRRKDGTIYDVEISTTGTTLYGEDGIYNASICICRDITEQKRVEQEIKYLSFHDSLTGLYNRRFFEAELKRLDVARNLPLSIVIGDLNGLKLINDALGHFTGDRLLQLAAEVLQKNCRADDIIARWGGDEFIIILPKTDETTTTEIIERINNASSSLAIEQIQLSISLGAATKSDPAENILKTLVAAETAMYRNKLHESQSVISQAIKVIHSTLLEKNPTEALHSRRVAEYCKKTAIAMGFSKTGAGEMETIGLLHDIGKIAVPDIILEKPSTLNSVERQEICRHPETGFRILSASNDTAEIARYILSHHEHYDGNGYPTGLKGEAIPLQARILAVADAYDAMTSNRPHRTAISQQDAIQELKTHAGTQFDPKIVNIFIKEVL